MHGLVAKPIRNDPRIDLIAKRGLEHERRYLDDLRAEGRTVVAIEKDGSAVAPPGAPDGAPTPWDPGADLRAAADETLEAMRSGADVVYQATFFDGTWRGHADFLLRRDHEPGEPDSAFGPWHYEVADTKLARHVKASAILQICSYVEQLTAIQGRQPEFLYVVLGGSARPTDRRRVDDFMAYYRRVKREFEAGGGHPRRGWSRGRLPARRLVPGARGALRGLPLEPPVQGAAPRGRRPEPGRGCRLPPAQRAQGPGRRDPSRPRRPGPADDAARSRTWAGRRWRASASRPGSRCSRRTQAASCGSCCRWTAGRTASRSRFAGSWACPSPARGTCSWTSRGTRSRWTTGWTTCSGSWSHACPRTTRAGRSGRRADSQVPRDLEPGRRRPRHLGIGEGGVRGDRRSDHGPLGA